MLLSVCYCSLLSNVLLQQALVPYTMRSSRICFLLVAWIICWLPSNAGVFSNIVCDSLMTDHRCRNDREILQRVGLPTLLQSGVLRARRLYASRGESGAGTKTKRRIFWKPNMRGPLPVDAIHGTDDDGESNELAQNRKAMRYG